MFRLMYSIIALLAIMHVAVLLGVGGYAVLTGKLDREKVEKIVATLRAGDGDPGAAALADGGGESDPGLDGTSSEARIMDALSDEELERLQTDRIRVELQHERVLLDRRMLKLQQEIAAFEERVEGHESRLSKAREQELSESFTQLVRTISGMKPKNALAALMARTEAEAVQILLEMSPRRRNQIIDSCKTGTQTRWRDAMFERMLQMSAHDEPQHQEAARP